jgi:hypothetical protein
MDIRWPPNILGNFFGGIFIDIKVTLKCTEALFIKLRAIIKLRPSLH